ncbi:MAG: energy transducer TonB [Saprospiraceae bacterium]
MMKSFSVFLFCSILFFGCKKDDDTAGKIEYLVEVNGDFVLMEIDNAPEYNDEGEEGLYNCIGENIKYPTEARENGVEGKVEVEYEISATGEIENIVPITNIGSGCEEALIEALKACTQGVVFSPAIIDGQAVRVKDSLWVNFRLE